MSGSEDTTLKSELRILLDYFLESLHVLDSLTPNPSPRAETPPWRGRWGEGGEAARESEMF